MQIDIRKMINNSADRDAVYDSNFKENAVIDNMADGEECFDPLRNYDSGSDDAYAQNPQASIIEKNFNIVIRPIMIDRLVPYHKHTFKVKKDEALQELAENIKKYGVIEPILIAKSRKYLDMYEIVSGHRRVEAAKLVGLDKIPSRDFVGNENDFSLLDEIMVITNLERRNTFSEMELAKSIKALYDARRSQRLKSDNDDGTDGGRTRDYVKAEFGIGTTAISQYLHLAELIDYFGEQLDDAKISKRAAYDLSHLNDDEQGYVRDELKRQNKEITAAQAAKLRKLSSEHQLDINMIARIIENEGNEKKKTIIALSSEILEKYFEGCSSGEVNKVIADALEMYFGREEIEK